MKLPAQILYQPIYNPHYITAITQISLVTLYLQNTYIRKNI
jgi:hypothetical protein